MIMRVAPDRLLAVGRYPPDAKKSSNWTVTGNLLRLMQL
jgi:hypothetical protein